MNEQPHLEYLDALIEVGAIVNYEYSVNPNTLLPVVRVYATTGAHWQTISDLLVEIMPDKFEWEVL